MERGLGETQILWPNEIVIVGNDQCSEKGFRVVAHLDSIEPPKHFGPERLRSSRYYDNVFTARVQIDPSDVQLLTRWVDGNHRDMACLGSRRFDMVAAMKTPAFGRCRGAAKQSGGTMFGELVY
jgi:hypothetical protein